ncbi:hypothetical protein [Microcoleus sp. herbarium12]|uniref:hypothetical protein n=1 Tax=Microcoleus sp. herbarium12 TaxID=3055437 RepID=UPI002FD704E0
MLDTSVVLQEVELFFMQQGKVYEALQNITQSLSRAGIDYAVIGGMALVIHGYVRTTQDVDLLMTPQGLDSFRSILLGRGFVPAFAGATKMFKDVKTGVSVKIITTGEFPGDGKPKSVSFPNPAAVAVEKDGIKVVRLVTLIELKLSSGLSGRGRLKDLADVQELIKALSLPAELAQELDRSVQEEYSRLWIDVQPDV